jgi:FtsP/CotA-like multicopper oxidase with cupredoxin domain
MPRARRALRACAAVAVACAATLAAAPGAGAATREYWVAAAPTTWDIAPNGQDPIHGTPVDAASRILRTVTYRRYTRGWRRPMRVPADTLAGAGRIPGPLLRARAGDRIVVHFKNLDTLTRAAHSMHFHGVDYAIGSDGSWVPGFPQRGGRVEVGRTHTYVLRARDDSVGVWPYHDHGPDMTRSLHGGMFGGLSILGRHEKRPDREFLVVFSEHNGFQTVNGRAFVGNTPVFRARVGETVQWDVIALGDAHHTFHVHGHRWMRGGVPEDTRTIGPAESFRVRWTERAPGTWLYHCHVEQHMMRGMIGLYHVRK